MVGGTALPDAGEVGGPSRLQPALREGTERGPAGRSTFLKRILGSRSKSLAQAEFDSQGSQGLRVLFAPSDPLIEYIFVHGLGGGSTRTWCLDQDPTLFWPEAWLPRHPAFRNVRIHTFGYNSNWKERGPSTVDVHDFGQALLLAMRNSPSFVKNPVVFVAHSMGGIVVKEAYIMARQDPACQDLASRIEAMIFLGTPHRGSSQATFLNRVLRLSAMHGSRQYITDLERCSASLVRINDTFRHFYADLTLYSYFETRPLQIGGTASAIIVQKDSAVMSLPGERVSMMDADHRSICKFSAPDDPNYTTLTETFATINTEISRRVSAEKSECLSEQLQRVERFLGMPETPEDDLRDLEDICMPESCDWFTNREQFQSWITTSSSPGSRIFWVYAKPATGKSVLASHIIDTIHGFNNDCSYYFFRHGDKIRSTLAGCLLSLTHQMALLNIHVRDKLLQMIDRGVRFEPDNPKNIWRKILHPALSATTQLQPQFWIIDALDECVDILAFFSTLLRLEADFPVKILVTSRHTEEIAAGFGQLNTVPAIAPLLSTEIQVGDTRDSIHLYLENNQHKLHIGMEDERRALLGRISAKAQGCFLWVRLVLEELGTVWTAQQVEQVLTDVPQEMDLLYSRAVQIIAGKPANSIAIARTILTWTVCAIRPMGIAELQAALQLDIGTTLENPEQAIPSICSQMVYEDRNGRVLMVHLTAKTFLQERGLNSPLAICPILEHRRIARVCLEFLVSDKMKPPAGRRSIGRKRVSQQQSAFLNYASFNFAEHMAKTTSNNTIITPLLYEMLQKNIFTWIQVIAMNDSLHTLTRTANLIKNYHQRRAKYFPLTREQTQLVNAWTIDLHRLVAKFGTNLVRQPSSIFSLVPPFCPTSSAVATVFGNPARRIRVVGLANDSWDDRMACIDSHHTQAYAVASGEGYFAIGFGSSIVLCHSTTCQRWKSVDHGSPIRQLGFDSTGTLLVSVGRRDIKVWDLEDTTLRFTFPVLSDVLSFSLQKEAAGLTVALKDTSTVRWSLETGATLSDVQWKTAFDDEGQFRRPPLLAAFSPDESVLAVAYRGRPITIWDLEEEEPLGLVGRESQDLGSLVLGTNTSPSSLVFNREESLPLLAAAYEDGDLCLFDYEEPSLLKTIEANAQVVACSPDGMMLATGNSRGMVQLLEFETLQILFQVNAVDYGIRSLAFGSDNSRFLDVRGTQCNVWEPALPSAKARKNDASLDSTPPEPRIVGLPDGEVEITTMAIETSGDWFFIGRSDGSVWLYRTADGKPQRLLYRHGYEISVIQMVWGDKASILVTADSAGRFIICSLERDGRGAFRDPSKLMDIKGDVHHKVAITQILLNKSNDLLLVSTLKSDTVWALQHYKVLSSRQFGARSPFNWVNNPLNPSERILLGMERASLWDWATCDVKIPEEELTLDLNLSAAGSPRIKSVSEVFGARIAVEYSELHGGSSTTTSLLLDPRDLVSGRTLTASRAFASACESPLHLIGTFESRIVFLDKKLCVCSVELLLGGDGGGGGGDGDGDKRLGFRHVNHFFIPADWHSQRTTLITRITSKGDILLVRTDEVAVIKHGLLFEEDKR